MTLPIIYSLAPFRANTTVLAVGNLQVPPNIATEAFRHSGNEYASALVVPGAEPRVRFMTPFYPAYTLIGFKVLKLTVADLYFGKFVDAIRSASSVHAKFALTTSAIAYMYIRSIKFANRGIAMAEVEVVYCSSDGLAHPMTRTDNNALPTLSGQPLLHTMGSSVINGTTVTGAASVDIDLGAQITVGIDGTPGDGLLYPTVAAYLGGTPVINVEHSDPMTLLTTLGLTGVPITSNFVQWLREYDATNHVALTTGLSLTMASGRLVPRDFGADNLGVAKIGVSMEPLSASATYPIVLATGSVP